MKDLILVFAVFFAVAGIITVATFDEEAYYDKRCSLPVAEQNSFDIEFCANRGK